MRKNLIQAQFRFASLGDDAPAHKVRITRVCRGGSWHTWAFYARSPYRNWNSPETRYTLVGMRLLREAGYRVKNYLCHPEQSEGSHPFAHSLRVEIPRFARDDKGSRTDDKVPPNRSSLPSDAN